MMLVGWLGRFGFRMRKQLEGVLAGRMEGAADVREKFENLEKLMITPEDHVLYKKNLMNVKHRFRKLVTVEGLETSLVDSATNEMMFRLYNDAIAAEMKSVIDEKDTATVLRIVRQLSRETPLHEDLLKNYSRTRPLVNEVRRRLSFVEDYISHFCFKGYTKLVRSAPI